MGLFLAQFTESIIYTDVGLNWRHLHQHATSASASKEPSPWLPVTDSMLSLAFLIESDAKMGYELRLKGGLDRVRDAMRLVQTSVRAQGKKPVSRNVAKKLAREVDEVKKILRREWQQIDTNESSSSYQGKLELSVPIGGFERNTVRRLLLTYGRAKQIRATPMALFMRVAPPNSPT